MIAIFAFVLLTILLRNVNLENRVVNVPAIKMSRANQGFCELYSSNL